MSKRAVIDLGTNTFHLLVAEIKGDKFEVVYKERKYVYLGENGVGTIGTAAYQRGIDVLIYFKEVIANYENVISTIALGTSALRNASNSGQFRVDARMKAGIEIEIISGNEEAELIAKGVGLLYEDKNNHLVMDIGGGSVEFIFGKENVLWKKSFKIGISILHELFHRSDPISPKDLDELDRYLNNQLAELMQMIKPFDSIDLIGAAGTFEVLSRDMNTSKPQLTEINQLSILKLFEEVRGLSYEQRKNHNLIPESRAKYIVVGLAIITHVLKSKHFERVLISPYALKEGVLARYLD